MMLDSAARIEEFRKLHASGCFVMPNPWDAGTARYLESLGFRALATTSAGFAFSRGKSDGGAVSRDEVLAHMRDIASAVDLPVNADFEAGYADEAEGVAANVALCLKTGVAGLSIEDRSPSEGQPLYELPRAVERIQAARQAIDTARSGVLLTGRAECYLSGHENPLAEALRRLPAYAEAGADVLFAPGVTKRDEIRALVEAVGPKPFNLLMSAEAGLRVTDAAALGVRRISVGSALSRAAWGGFSRAALAIAQEGNFGLLSEGLPYGELNSFFSKDRRVKDR